MSSKRLLLPVFILALFAFRISLSPAFAQSLQVSKSPGETLTLAWSFATLDEASIDGFALQSASTVDGTYTDVKTVLKTARSTTTTVGSAPMFYKLLSYKNVTPRQESERSNPVAVTIVLKPPLGLGAN